LADREHLNQHGRPITFETYYALPFGPVATNALDMIKGDRSVLSKAGIQKLPIKITKRNKTYYLDGPERSVNRDVFSKSDLRVFDKILLKHGGKTFGELFGLTHSHYAYKNAWKKRGQGKSVLMAYEDMLQEGAIKKAGFRKEDIVKDLEQVSSNM
jgi:hypothetical protein